jgi:hypothetical protein
MSISVGVGARPARVLMGRLGHFLALRIKLDGMLTRDVLIEGLPRLL